MTDKSMTDAAYWGAILLTLFLILRLFSDAEKGERRRLLQNVIYRGFRFLGWMTAVWSALDAALLIYYQKRDIAMILPSCEQAPYQARAKMPLPRSIPWEPREEQK